MLIIEDLQIAMNFVSRLEIIKMLKSKGLQKAFFVFMNCDIATNIYMALKGYFED